MPLPPREFLQALTTEERDELHAARHRRSASTRARCCSSAGRRPTSSSSCSPGACRVTRDGDALAERGPGALIGEMAIVDGTPRSASVEAIEAGEILTVSANNFRGFIARTPHAALAVIEQLGRRLRQAERR